MERSNRWEHQVLKTNSKNPQSAITRRDNLRERLASVQPLLVPRAVTKKMLSVSTLQIIRFEKLGMLDAIRLNPHSAVGQVHHRYEQVVALVNNASARSKDLTEVEEEEERPRRRKSRGEASAGQ
jgi:hypothetical protein